MKNARPKVFPRGGASPPPLPSRSAWRGGVALPILALSLVPLMPLASQVPFEEVAASRGLQAIVYFGNWSGPWGFGLALNDLDGDGDPDAVITGAGIEAEVRIYENDGSGSFTDRTPITGVPSGPAYAGISAADYDGDGDLDLYLSGWGASGRLLRNDGGFQFTDVTGPAQVGSAALSTGSVWGDVDGDGWLDLYVCNRTQVSPGSPEGAVPNLLFRNRGNGTFEEVAEPLGVADPDPSFQALFLDHDRDGDPDLYVSNDKGNPSNSIRNRLYRNDGGTFVDISDASAAGIAIDSMGIDSGDFDGDGFPDIYATNTWPEGNKLLLSSSNGTYSEDAAGFGVTANITGWGSLFWDFDQDGHLDLFTANTGDNLLFTHGGIPPCQEVATTYALRGVAAGGPSDSYACATGDIDGDGDPDLLVQSWNRPIALYLNREGESRHWLRIRLRHPPPNTHAIGAWVQLDRLAGVRRQEVRAGRGFKSSSELVAHFGLGSELVVPRVTVRWPDRRVSVLLGVASDQVLEIDRTGVEAFLDCDGDFLPDAEQIAADPALDANGNLVLDSCEHPFLRGDGNGDGTLDIADPVAALHHMFSGGPSGCPDAMDANDDGRLDIADAVRLLELLFGVGQPLPPPRSGCGLDPTPDAGGEDLGCPSPSPSCVP